MAILRVETQFLFLFVTDLMCAGYMYISRVYTSTFLSVVMSLLIRIDTSSTYNSSFESLITKIIKQSVSLDSIIYNVS